MAKKRTIYRDYREGKTGQFASKKAFENQGPADGVHAEKVDTRNIINDIDILFDFDEEDTEDFDIYEYHGTGDTGRRE